VYPEDAKTENVFGRVTIQFAVTTTGKVSDVVVVRGIDDRLDSEAKRVILSSPDWKPATQKGIPVKQMFTIPVVFALTEEMNEP
jgi:protein TonB